MAATHLPPKAACGVVVVIIVAVVVVRRRWAVLSARTSWLALMAVLLVAATALGVVRVLVIQNGLVADLASERASIRATVDVTTDPRQVDTAFGTAVVFSATVRVLDARGLRSRLRTPVVVWVRGDDPGVRLGERVQAVGRLGPSRDSATAAMLSVSRVHSIPEGEPAWWWDGAQVVRGAVTASIAGRGEHVPALVPALVHGDDHALSDELREAFRTSGLTHLLAVSGTNLTLLVGFLLALARPLGAGPRTRVVLAVLATIGYVLLARPEPSVVRAAVMGLVGVAGLSTGGRARGARCLSWAIVVVVLLDPWLATSAGFLLSALATGGILLLAPVWRDALARWMPAWAAEAIAVPAAAQLACTAPVAALSGEVSVVAVAANLLAAPAVGPATVLGLSGGLVGMVYEPFGCLVGFVTAVPAGWVVTVGLRSASVPGAAAVVGQGPVVVAVLALVSVAIAVTGHRLLRRPLLTTVLLVVVTALALAPPTAGWPPPGWVMVACDVGQGDATVIRTSDDAALVVDAGPDEPSVDRCLRDLGITHVPILVLTHAHADHVDGLGGVVRGRAIGWVGLGPSRPAPAQTEGRGLPARVLAAGERWQVGEAALTVLAPVTASGQEGANDASVVLLVETAGIRILLTGDIEPPAQQSLARAYPELQVDVIKVPHHGSAHQDRRWLTGLGARWATVSAGEGNTYGHPNPEILQLLRAAGVTVLRTDPGQDVAVVVDDGQTTGVRR